MLVLEGTDVKTLNRARFIEVLTPLNTVVAVAGGCSMLLMFPLFAASMTKPATLLSFFGGIALCYALVSVGAFALEPCRRQPESHRLPCRRLIARSQELRKA